ncbi:MAG: hypothetical protein E7671_01725 [Ruminococcaceae bacterium]|nr:hypothetical protein [Oscillospiraceae bacterium]
MDGNTPKKEKIFSPESNTSVCWLRTPGENQVYVSTISFVGKLNSKGIYHYSYITGVRPAVWVDVSR